MPGRSVFGDDRTGREAAVGGIAVQLAADSPGSADLVRTMSAAAPHRGSRVDVVVLGRGALACATHDDRPDATVAVVEGVAAALVGKIDNAAELERDILSGNREPHAPRTDAELVAELFRAVGDDFPDRLRGVFSGAVTTGDRVYCFRDQLGYSPLFYRHDPNGFYAATEAKQVVAGAGIAKEPDLEVVERILFDDIDDEMPSALRGVRRLPKSTLVTSDGERVALRRYWWPESLLETARISSDEIQERFDELMDRAAFRCVTGQDAISLSGGVDSPAVAAFAAPHHMEASGRPLQALSVVYPDHPAVDERRYIEIVADRLQLPVHMYQQHANALDGLGEWIALADGPFHSASLAHYAEDYRLARSMGFGTLLTGEHAEFVFNMQAFVLGHYLTHGHFRSAAHELAEFRKRGTPLWWLPVAVARGMAPTFVVAAKRRRARFGVPPWVDLGKANESAARSFVSARERWRTLQLSALIGPGLSVEAEEICQSVCGVRARRPWTDVDLFEFFLSLPAEVKFPDRGNKSLVRRLLRGHVPDEILDRRDKTVFDDSVLQQIDWGTLQTTLLKPSHRISGIDYELLGSRLEQRRIDTVQEYAWARNLAASHMFLSQW